MLQCQITFNKQTIGRVILDPHHIRIIDDHVMSCHRRQPPIRSAAVGVTGDGISSIFEPMTSNEDPLSCSGVAVDSTGSSCVTRRDGGHDECWLADGGR